MEYRKLGNSDLDISVITLGAWAYGCEKYWGKVSLKDIKKVITGAVDKGINMIDTAIGYDNSEIIVGDAIKDIKDDVYITTKGGADPRRIEERVNLSLKRLGLNCIDLYLVHYPDNEIPVEETMGAMADVMKKGKIRNIGVSNFSADQIKKALSVTDISCCQSAYNLMWREIEDAGILEVCLKNNIGITCYSPLGQGLFTGKIRSEEDIPEREGDIRQITVLFKGKAFKDSLEIIKILDSLSKKYGKSPAQIAINWVINQEGITTAIVGMKNSRQLEDNIGAIGWKMEKEDYKKLSGKGSQFSKVFDYSYSMFGMKYSEVKIDEMIDDSLKEMDN